MKLNTPVIWPSFHSPPKSSTLILMVKLTGLFDTFDNLDSLEAENIVRWLKPIPQTVQVENYLANKILYPQTVPVTKEDMQLDLAILREALRINGPKSRMVGGSDLLGDNAFLNITLRKIVIPQKFLQFMPDLVSITWAFVDGLLLERKRQDWFEDLWTVVVSDDTDQIVGSVLLPQFQSNLSKLNLAFQGKNFEVRPGSLTVLPCPFERCEITFKFNQGKFMGKTESVLELSGGNLGLIIDGRM